MTVESGSDGLAPGGAIASEHTAAPMMHPLLAVAIAVTSLAGPPIVVPVSHSPVPASFGGARWGEYGHRLIGRAAADELPDGTPPFFRAAAAQLAYLNPEPDRWRSGAEQALDPALGSASAPEHYVDMEVVPARALGAPDRFAYADSLGRGQDVAAAGLLPYRILELTQRLRVGFRQWRAATDSAERAWIEARIVDDAGILGHYVADGSNPHHTTVHHHGWVGENPRGFSTESGIHSRFEGSYVATHIELAEVERAMGAPPRDVGDIRAAVWTYLGQTHGLVERLYELDLEEPFGRTTTGADHEAFVVERLAAGAEMLRDLWWTAWVSSAPGE